MHVGLGVSETRNCPFLEWERNAVVVASVVVEHISESESLVQMLLGRVSLLCMTSTAGKVVSSGQRDSPLDRMSRNGYFCLV